MKTDKMRAILTILSLVMLLTVVICTTSCNNTPVEPNDTTDGRESTEAPTEDPTTEDPTTEDPTTEDPTTEDPATEDPTTEEPTTEEPTTEEPTTEEPTTEDPTTEEPTTEPEPEVAVLKPYTNCNHHDVYAPENMIDGDPTTFFWTAGNLNTAAGGQTGYFGIDLGKVTDVENIYILMGAGGSDYLKQGILEYSVDGENWTIVAEGECSAEILIKDIAISARYLRVRAIDTEDTTWIKVCSFEVNVKVTNVTYSTSLNTYDTYIPGLMGDGDANTYFWSAGGGAAGTYIEMDLGEVVAITHLSFYSGVPGHEADKVVSGELCYSEDGESWTVIGALNDGKADVDVSINARYVRVRLTEEQGAWITVSEFSAVTA